MMNKELSQEEIDRIMLDEIEKSDSERRKDIEELGHPEWIVSAFLRLRRLAEFLERGKPQRTHSEIADEITQILQAFPEALFVYEKKCQDAVDAAASELLEVFKEMESRTTDS